MSDVRVIQWGNRDGDRVWRYQNYAAAVAALRLHGGALVSRRRATGGRWTRWAALTDEAQP